MVKLVLALAAIGAGLLALTPRCDAAAGGSTAGVVRSIYVNQKGGAGFKSIQAAIDSIPLGNHQWVRVHVAAGVYREKVNVPTNKSFILLEGEGRQQTSIEWTDHAGGQSGTANSPTFASYATDFIARDITFKNTYDGIRYMAPAVAALVAGDRSSFYRCSFVSVQDTLCDLLGRHHYQNCYIEGSMDFIFGAGQSIFEGCEISTGKTSVTPGFITAQGRDSEKDDSGFVFKRCKVDGVTPAYLGRAWRSYARVIFYQTVMSSVVVREGWDAWNYKGKDWGAPRWHHLSPDTYYTKLSSLSDSASCFKPCLCFGHLSPCPPVTSTSEMGARQCACWILRVVLHIYLLIRVADIAYRY